MTVFTYTAIDDDSNDVRGSIDALDLDAAKTALASQHLDVVSISEASRTRGERAEDVPPPVPRDPTLKTTFAFEGMDAIGAVHRGVVEAETKYQAFERLKKDQKLMLTMLSPVGVTPHYKDNDLQNWQRKELMNPPSPPPLPSGVATSPLQAAPTAPTPRVPVRPKSVGFTLDDSPMVKTAPKPAPARSPSVPRSYHSLVTTLRLYAGWLLAWYGLFVALGYYVTVRTMPVDIPFVQAFFLSPLIFTFIVAIFLFLLLGAMHRTMKGGVVTGIVLTVIGAAAFVGVRMNI